MYPVFGTMSRLLGAETIALPVHPSTNFMPDPRRYVTPEQESRLRVLFINYPHNPTGQVATREYLQGLVDFARERGLIIVSDMAYGEIFYGTGASPAPTNDGGQRPPVPNEKPPSMLELDGALDCAIEMHSFSKSFNMTGWRVGFAVGNAALIEGLLRVKSNVDSGCFNAIQLAMARVLDDPQCDSFLAENRAHYKARMEKVAGALEEMGLKVHRPGGAIFIWCEVPVRASGRPGAIAGQPSSKAQPSTERNDNPGGSDNLTGEGAGSTEQSALPDSIAWCSKLLDETGLVVSPGAGYGHYGEGFFRVSLSTPDADIDKALDKLRSFVRKG
jgi:LL-diaminopimelate aminotransferase